MIEGRQMGKPEKKQKKDGPSTGAGQGERRLSEAQYKMILRCSEKRDMTEWNEWRKENPDEEVLLEEADLKSAYLKGVDLKKAYLKGADLKRVHLEDADVSGADLREAKFRDAYLTNADISGARLEGANFYHAYLEGVDLAGADLKGAKLLRVHLQHGSIEECNLEGVDLWRAHLEGVFLSKSCLKGANLTEVIVDGATLIDNCIIDRKTDFSGVGLHNARIAPGTKQLLQYNVRRKHWEEWYGGDRFLQWPVRWFWWLSDYGSSTWQIIKAFLILAVGFAVVYYAWGAIDYYGLKVRTRPGIVSNLFVLQGTAEVVSRGQVPFRALYFSIVTMTTLGFGDMYANVATELDYRYANIRCVCGHLLLVIQVTLGYVLLGALVTRFAVLFSAGGPAGKFAEEKEEK
jgi:hypothetical protein